MSSKPLLSIIVPTRDRPHTLGACLKTLLSQDFSDLEIVVSDNASSPKTQEVLSAFDDPRLRLLRTDIRLGMAEHFDFALSQSSGQWVTFIGDDDGMLPGSFECFAALAESNDVDAICSDRCNYIWPEAYDGVNGVLNLRGGSDFEIRDSREWLTEVIKGRQGYGTLPWVYAGGFVRRTVLDKIREKMGRYFSSINPDAYSAVAVASTVPSYGYSSIPMAIEGTGPSSVGRLWLDGDLLETKEHPLFKESSIEFHPSLGDGNVHSLPLIVYEAFLQSEPLRDFTIETDLAEQISIALSVPKKKTLKQVQDYCRRLAADSGLEFEPLEARSRKLRRRTSISKKLRRFATQLGMGEKELYPRIKSKALSDVYEAAVFGAGLLAKNSHAPAMRAAKG